LVKWLDVEHCWDCDVCIEGLDHHCPWTSKCIGKGNLVTFYVFVTTSCGLFIYLIVMASLGAGHVVKKIHNQ
jgi:hypothetical protein